MSAALGKSVHLDRAVEERLRHVVESLVCSIATNIKPPVLGRSISSSRPLPLSRTLSGTLWAQRHDQILRKLAAQLGLTELPASVDWGPSIPPPGDDIANAVVNGCSNAVDMNEARELLMGVAFQDARTDATTQDVQTALQLLHEEQRRRPTCVNGHTLTKGRRKDSWCNSCNNGFIPKDVDPVFFFALPKPLQQEQREASKCLIMSDYLCKQCEYFCCDKCFLGKGRGTMLQACIRASRGIVDPPDTDWRTYEEYDAFSGENVAEDRFPEVASDGAETVEAQAIEIAKAKCISSAFGGFAVFKGKVYYRRQSSADCHANLRPAEDVTFHVAPRPDNTEVQQRATEADKQRAEEHQGKIEALKELVSSMGCGILNDHQAVYWLEQGSYLPENAIAVLLDAADLSPPSNWTSSCSCQSCRSEATNRV